MKDGIVAETLVCKLISLNPVAKLEILFSFKRDTDVIKISNLVLATRLAGPKTT